jgi:hypothetical protein
LFEEERRSRFSGKHINHNAKLSTFFTSELPSGKSKSSDFTTVLGCIRQRHAKFSHTTTTGNFSCISTTSSPKLLTR